MSSLETARSAQAEPVSKNDGLTKETLKQQRRDTTTAPCGVDNAYGKRMSRRRHPSTTSLSVRCPTENT